MGAYFCLLEVLATSTRTNVSVYSVRATSDLIAKLEIWGNARHPKSNWGKNLRE